MESVKNAPAWGALAIALLADFSVSPEEASELYETGLITLAGTTYRIETVINSRRIERLRKRGCAWWSIESLTGVQSPQSYLYQRRGILEAIRQREAALCRLEEMENV